MYVHIMKNFQDPPVMCNLTHGQISANKSSLLFTSARLVARGSDTSGDNSLSSQCLWRWESFSGWFHHEEIHSGTCRLRFIGFIFYFLLLLSRNDEKISISSAVCYRSMISIVLMVSILINFKWFHDDGENTFCGRIWVFFILGVYVPL